MERCRICHAMERVEKYRDMKRDEERWGEVERGGERWREMEKGGERWRAKLPVWRTLLVAGSVISPDAACSAVTSECAGGLGR